MQFTRAQSNQSAEQQPSDTIYAIREEIEILEATLAPYEFSDEVEIGDDGDGGTFETHNVKLTIAPAALEGQKIAIYVEDESRYIPVQFLPRLVLKFSFVLKPDKVGSYPQREMPPYQIEGYFAKKAYQIYSGFQSRYNAGNPCLFEWFSFAKDELFADENDIDAYSPSFFDKNDEYACLVAVRDNSELQLLLDELHATALIRAEAEPLPCMICFSIPETMENVQLFRTCRHAFCTSCIKGHAEVLIKDGSVDKLICPAFDEATNKPCTAAISETDLEAVGVDPDLIEKVIVFSVSKAIDQMADFGWCPEAHCNAPAEIDEERNLGKCTGCRFKFCTQCKKKFHPFKRCEKATMHLAKNEENILDAKNYLEERLNLLYIQNCSKACPTCGFSIQKTAGCNKMECQQCRTKFCWHCMALLQRDQPYKHFESNPECWNDFGEGQDEELKQEVIDAQGFDPDKMTLSQTQIDNTANCPTCHRMTSRDQQTRCNQLCCAKCKIFFCFNCGKNIGTVEGGFEAAKLHYEAAFCHFRPLS